MASRLTIYQAAVSIAALVGVTILAALGKVSGDTVTVIYSAVIGAGLGAGGAIANGYAQKKTGNGSQGK